LLNESRIPIYLTNLISTKIKVNKNIIWFQKDYWKYWKYAFGWILQHLLEWLFLPLYKSTCF
jgi:hypothetical protein